MNHSSLFRQLLFTCSVIILPVVASAKQWVSSKPDLHDLHLVALTDSISKKQPVKPDDNNQDGQKPQIKEVPKSRRQLKPVSVGAGIKIKTPVKVRPNIIRPPGLIRKALGR